VIKACILKLGWKLNFGPNGYWREVLKEKYRCGSTFEEMMARPTDSSLWKVVNLCPNLNECRYWSSGYVKMVNAWPNI